MLQSSICKTTNAGTVLNFFTKCCDVNRLDELEMDTDSLYLAIAEEETEDCMRPELKTDWEQLRSKHCSDGFTADASGNFSPGIYCYGRKRYKREPGVLKEKFKCTEMLCLCSKSYCCYGVTSNEFKLSSKSFSWHLLEQNNDGPLDKFRRVLDEKNNIASLNIFPHKQSRCCYV